MAGCLEKEKDRRYVAKWRKEKKLVRELLKTNLTFFVWSIVLSSGKYRSRAPFAKEYYMKSFFLSCNSCNIFLAFKGVWFWCV